MNLVLNGLVREGVMFQTSFDKAASTKRVSITAVAPSANSPEAVNHAVTTALDRFADDVTVKAG